MSDTLKRFSEFLTQVRTELAKIEWPDLYEFIGSVIVALLVVLFLSTFVGIVDSALALLAKQIFAYTL